MIARGLTATPHRSPWQMAMSICGVCGARRPWIETAVAYTFVFVPSHNKCEQGNTAETRPMLLVACFRTDFLLCCLVLLSQA